jgi:hypothetical protein
MALTAHSGRPKCSAKCGGRKMMTGSESARSGAAGAANAMS